MLPIPIRTRQMEGKRGHTNGEAFDGFVLWSATGTVGATDEFGVSTTMFVSAVVSAQS